MKPLRKPLVAANWKMNMLPTKAVSFIEEFLIHADPSHDYVIAPPFTHLSELGQFLRKGLKLGAQNCHEELSGPYTGEVSASMLVDLGVSYVILGHSERREMNLRENILVSKKIKTALSQGLKVIYCCGESYELRSEGIHLEHIINQLEEDIGVDLGKNLKNVTIAYEPIWAIGTGSSATPAQAQEMHKHIRQWIADQYGSEFKESIRILYGGSVKASNALALSSQPDIDGALVGGASLDIQEFVSIGQAFNTV